MPYRLRDKRGESLIETLVALLVAAFAIALFAGMIFTASRVTKSGREWNAYINDRAALLEQRTDSGGGVTLDSAVGNISITTQSGDELINLIDDSASMTFFVTEYAENSGEKVIAYAKTP